MNVPGSRLTIVGVWTWLCLALAVAACQRGLDEDVTAKNPYSDLIGAKYRVVSDEVYAYGVYESLNNRKIRFVDLIPLQIRGPEIAFERPVQKGQVIRIISAWRRSSILRRRVYYVVAVENSNLPDRVPVWLELSRGNEGVGADLNPAIYRRLTKDP
jgi:hypothetical protein